jgi:hypothetical protein
LLSVRLNSFAFYPSPPHFLFFFLRKKKGKRGGNGQKKKWWEGDKRKTKNEKQKTEDCSLGDKLKHVWVTQVSKALASRCA